MSMERLGVTLIIGLAVFSLFIVYFVLQERLQRRRRRGLKDRRCELNNLLVMDVDTSDDDDDEGDQHVSDEPSCLAVVSFSHPSTVASICVSLATHELFYFVEQINLGKNECMNDVDENVEAMRTKRMVNALKMAMMAWADKWILVDNVDLLIDHFHTAKHFNGGPETRWLRDFERSNDCRVFIQCGENFVCDQHANEVLWMDTVRRTRLLLAIEHYSEVEEEAVWHDYVLSKWRRRRIVPNNLRPLVSLN